MDRLLSRQLAAIDRDRQSGAAELAVRAASHIEAWLARHPAAARRDLEALARRLCHTQPMMAPFRSLANLAAIAADEVGQGPRGLRQSLREFARTSRTGPASIARLFRASLRRHRRTTIVTFSYSSTVLRALVAAKSAIKIVYVSLASPENEGRTMALRLASAGVPTCLTTDVDLPHFLEAGTRTLLVVGADQVRERDFVNRAGTDLLVATARRNRVPCCVLADSTKLASRKRMGLADVYAGWPEQLGPRRRPHLQLSRRVLSASPLASHVRVLTERGWFTAAQIRREIAAMCVSPRLHQLAD